MFQNYRIPRENLLNQTGDVTLEGEYESSFSDPARILRAVLEALSAARVGISQESCNHLICGVTIAVRYAAVRRQFGPSEGVEVPIIEYQLHVKNIVVAYYGKVRFFVFSNGDYFPMLPQRLF